jgi:NSS family neurotransmitter:Na+ symporter
MDLEDFIVSNNILPLGSLVYVLFCTIDNKAWGWNQFLTEANLGNGLKLSNKFKIYCKYVIPVLLVIFYVYGFISKIFPGLLA